MTLVLATFLMFCCAIVSTAVKNEFSVVGNVSLPLFVGIIFSYLPFLCFKCQRSKLPLGFAPSVQFFDFARCIIDGIVAVQ